jgi:formate C-acetyltransferase
MEYYNICVAGAALATTADSVAAIEQRLDREKRFGWDTLYKTLKDNYSGREGAYIRSMMRASERFGAGASLGDRWAQRISRDFTRIVSEKHTPDGYLMIPGLFTWANTINMGRDTPATANGRLSGEPISHGANPDPGFRKDGALTVLSNAVASVQPGRGNTAPLQLELDPSLASRDELVSIVEALIKSHFEKGGTLININVMDKDVLLDAYAHPEKHQDLIVRVTGFTAYFSVLGPDFRKMVIDRVIQAE